MKEKDDDIGMCKALRILAGIKDEKSFKALIDMLSYPHEDVQYTAIELLGRYGDKGAVEHLEKLLEEEETRDGALDSIRRLVDLQTYREVLTKDAERRLKKFTDSIRSMIQDLKHEYEFPQKLVGDKADKMENYITEYKIRNIFASILRETIDLGLQEAAISDSLRDELYDSHRKIHKEISKLSKYFGVAPEIANEIVSGYYPFSLKTDERSFQSVRTARENLVSGISKWLRDNRFQVIVREEWLVWGWRKKPLEFKGIVVTINDPLTTRLWGESWTDKEATSFLSLFWQFVEKLDFELLPMPRTGRVLAWQKWKEILVKRGVDTDTIRSIEETLLHCYVGTQMGLKSIPPSIIPNLEFLSAPDIRLIQVSKCNEDTLSDHKAKTCRVKLARLTDAGFSVAKEIHLGTLDRRIGELTEALSRLPERERGIVGHLIGKRVLSGETGIWDITVPFFQVVKYMGFIPPCFRSQVEERTILPPGTHKSISTIKEKLLNLGLVAPSWTHTVSGFTEDTLVAAPETLEKLSAEIGSYELHSYLQSCQKFIRFLKSKLDLLLDLTPYGDRYGGKIENRYIRRFAEDFSISERLILDWLQELQSAFPNLISEIDVKAMESTEEAVVCQIAEGDRYKLDYLIVISYPKLVEMLRAESAEEACFEVLENIKEWLATGKERPFTSHLKIEKNLSHPLDFSLCTRKK